MSSLLLAPYLPLAKPQLIVDWRLVPFKDVPDDDVFPERVRRPVERLISAYRRDDGMGAVVHLDGQAVGAEFAMDDFRRIGFALLAGVVGGNPDLASASDDGNRGWSIATSENAMVVGHPIGDGNSYAIQIGVLARVLSGRGADDDEPLPPIDAPVELPAPMFGSMDDELAAAVYVALGVGDDEARQLERALEWYRVVLSNAEAVSIDVRMGAARSALEVLLGVGDKTKQIVRAFGSLVQTADSEERTYEGIFWANGPVQLTDDEWWLTRLCELRNAIMHGAEVPKELWTHDGHHQLNQVHDKLLLALRAFAAERSGDDLLRLTLQDRIWARAHQKMVEAIEAAEAEEPPPAPAQPKSEGPDGSLAE